MKKENFRHCPPILGLQPFDLKQMQAISLLAVKISSANEVYNSVLDDRKQQSQIGKDLDKYMEFN